MTSEILHEEISIELELMAKIVYEVSSLCHDVAGRPATVREKTAGAAFLAQFYGGIENILKRIHRYYKLPLPVGETWHLDLFNRFCSSGYEMLPVLFDNNLASALSPFRKFRHVVHHGYGFQRVLLSVWSLPTLKIWCLKGLCGSKTSPVIVMPIFLHRKAWPKKVGSPTNT